LVRQIVIRLGAGVFTLWAVSLAIFLATRALPGDAAQVALGQSATPVLVTGLRKEFGLDRPLLTQYRDWLGGFLHGDLGHSLPGGTPVSTIVNQRIGNTAILAGLTLLLLVPVSLALGIASAARARRLLDQSIGAITLGLVATPEFVLGSMLALALSVWLGWLPPVSLANSTGALFEHPEVLVLPILTLLAASAGQTVRMVRVTMIEVLDSPYIDMARLKGVKERDVLVRHALPNAVGPLIQVVTLNIPWLLGGAIIVESVFAYPGLGSALVGAVSARDLPTVASISVIIASVVVVANLLADVLIIVMNPRLKRPRG
jgi:peptide/nickel transport system permease protein